METKRSNNNLLSWVFWVILPGMIFLFLEGCNKDGVCFSDTGAITRETRMVDDFDSIDIRGNVDVYLHQDTVSKVVVEAGKNIIPGIMTKVADRQLMINNYNTCNWLRSYEKPINVYVSVKRLWKIYYMSSGNVTALDTIRSDSLDIEAWGGCGTIDLLVLTKTGQFLLQMGTVDFKLRGVCPITSIFAGDFGLFDTRNMLSSYTYVTNRGTNDCYVYANYYLEATIGSIGNIYYTGNPKIVKTHIEGGGQVIPF